MSEEQLKAFREAIQTDTTLQQKLQGITGPDAIVAIAKEAGFSISADELKNAMESVELSEEQLEGVAGGSIPFPREVREVVRVMGKSGYQFFE